MNTDLHPSQLKGNQYSFALNAINDGLEGQPLIGNEPSNLLCSAFKEGYRVNGEPLLDINNNRVFYFLVNPTNNCSEIGYISELFEITNLDDGIKSCNCDISVKLAEPLEDQEQTPTCTYTTLLSDCDGCPEGTTANKCLNFNVNYPISSELGVNKCGTVIYFTDDLNFRRKLEVDNIEQYYLQEEECTESEVSESEVCDCGILETSVCINCEKLLLQKPFQVPCIDVEGLVNGGNLKHGVYEFYAAYTDGNGNEMTRYMAVTGEVPVKDPNKTIYQQPELDAPTNYSIKLNVSGLDINYDFYKIAVKQITSVDGAVSYYEVGVFPTTTNEVIYSGGEANLLRSTVNQIAADYPLYTKAKTVESANNTLFFTDLETQQEINLQPVVNFIGQFAKWRTSIAEESLYASAEACAKYRSFLRDEVVPFSIRFFTNTGYVTANFPLISRAKTDEDILFDGESDVINQTSIIDELVSDYNNDSLSDQTGNWTKDVISVLANGTTNCTSVERYNKWQYYNTAEQTTQLDCGDIVTEQADITVQRSCVRKAEVSIIIEDEIVLTEFNEGEIFTTLLDYVLNHQDDLEGVYDYLITETYEDTESAVDSEIPCCEPEFTSNCEGDAELVNQIIRFVDIDEESLVIGVNYEDCAEYNPNGSPDFCNIYERDAEGNYKNINVCFFREDPTLEDCTCSDYECYPYSCYVGVHEGFDPDYSNFTFSSPLDDWVFAREKSITGGDTCVGAHDIMYNQDIQLPAHLNVIFNQDEDLLTTKIAEIPTDCSVDTEESDVANGNLAEYIRTIGCVQPRTDANWSLFIHSNALWFKHTGINKIETPQLVLNISKMTKKSTQQKDRDCLKYAKFLRVSVYTDCSNSTPPFATYCVDVDEGRVVCIDVENESEVLSENGTIYIAIDTPLISDIELNTTDRTTDESIVALCDTPEYLSPTWGCFSVNINSPTITGTRITGDFTLFIRKICTYEKQCSTTIIKDEIRCDPIPRFEGKFAYWESIINYPNNEYLYDSSNLQIPSDYFDDFESEVISDFENTFVDSETNGIYVLNENTDFRCKPIRHFKFPDVRISPITDGNASEGTFNPPFRLNKIYPIGLYIDNNIINKFLDLAVINGLITQEFRDTIKGYEIFKGDVRLNRSIIGKGLMYDMYTYQEENSTDDIHFSNFPYNDLGDNELLFTDKTRNDVIPHPQGGEGNTKFVFHSPEFSFDKPGLPFELKVEAYNLGNSRGKFTEVNRHPKMVLLGRSAYRWATALGTIEAALSFLTDITDRLIQTAQTSLVGLSSNVAQWGAWIIFGTYVGSRASNLILVDVFQKRYEWLKIFDENGTPYNFAAYYTSTGIYNSFAVPDIIGAEMGETLRGLRGRKYIKNGSYSFKDNFEQININNFNRESGVYLSVAKDEDFSLFGLNHSISFITYDNSRTTLIQEGICNEQQNADFDTNRSREITKYLYAPYVSLKNYVPAQYGELDSIKWLSTHYCGRLDEDNSCDVIFGGETFLSRFYLKRKFPFFKYPMLIGKNAEPDLTPFSYTKQRNIGFPRYYVDYNVDQSYNFGSFEMPDIRSYYNLDCQYEPKMYVRPPSKFYLYYYGIPSFIVESRINLNFRYGENNEEKDFAPNQSDYIDWTQESKVPISEDNYYFYNPIYSHDNDLYNYRILPFNYNPDEWDCRSDHWDRTIYSLEEGEVKPQNDFVDRWGVFLARNKYDFGNKFGKIFMLKNIESQKVLGLFENGAVVFNVYNTLKGSVEDVQLGSGGIFGTKPTEFYKTPLGYGGTQHRQFVSSEFGHFWTDAKRGRVHSLNPNGDGEDEISRYGMKNWFKENLPFKIKKDFPNIDDDFLDNPYNGIGITMTWDDRFSRLFITKKDYQLTDADCCDISYVEGIGFVNTLLGQCGGCQFDLMFVVDESGSVDTTEMTQQKQFIKDIIELLREHIENGDIKIGFTKFDSIALFTQSMISGSGATDTLKNSIDTNIDVAGSGDTAINEGLCAAHQEFLANGRNNISKKIITITDMFYDANNGLFTPGSIPPSLALCSPLFSTNVAADTENDLNSLNYENIVIGINIQNTPSITVLNTIHNSDVNNGEAYLAEFVDLNELVEDVFLSICDNTTEIINPAESDCFEECSWTVSYLPLTKTWISFYSFFPNYYVSFSNYFQSGYNFGENTGIFSHLLTNRSYGVYQGIFYPFIIDIPVKNSPSKKWYEEFVFKTYSMRYSSTYDFAHRDETFNKIIIYNDRENSGLLYTKQAAKNNQKQYINYPKYFSDHWEVLIHKEDNLLNINTFYDLVRDNHNSPIWFFDCSGVNKTLNNSVLNYSPSFKNHFRGQWANIRFILDNESRIKVNFEYLISGYKEY